MSLTFHQSSVLLPKMFVVRDVMRQSNNREARVLSAPSAWWEWFSHHCGHFVFFCVPGIVHHPVNAGRWDLVPRLVDFCQLRTLFGCAFAAQLVL
jgi:hypothetical protein